MNNKCCGICGHDAPHSAIIDGVHIGGCTIAGCHCKTFHEPKTIRDEFAMAFMGCYIAHYGDGESKMEDVARWAYYAAEAMIEARRA